MSFSYKKSSGVEETWGRASDVSRFLERTSYDSLMYSYKTRLTTEICKKSRQLDDDPNRLPYFKACLFATVLEDALMQLKILEECNTAMSISRVMTEITSLLSNKYGVKEETVKDELEGIDPKQLDCLEYSLKKLQRDRDSVHQVLNETYSNLSMERKFEPLNQHVDDIDNTYTRLHDLTEEESKNKICRHDAYRHLRQHRNHIKSVTYDIAIEIENLKSYLEDAEMISESRSRYVSNWQRSCAEQQMQIISNKEITPTENIEYFKMKFDQEQRVHTEIEVLVNIKINETLENVQEWMEKFDKDMERLDLKIQLKRNEYEHTYEKRLELEKRIKKHADLIMSWKTFKEDREAVRLYKEKMNNAAITVQAWWRGLLVRQCLGPYKVAKKKGKKR